MARIVTRPDGSRYVVADQQQSLSPFQRWVANQGWLQTANRFAAPFEQGSRFGIGGGGQIGRGAGLTNNLIGALGITAGALAFLPASALRALQGARTADEALQIARAAKATKLADEIVAGSRTGRQGETLLASARTGAKLGAKTVANPLVRGAMTVIKNKAGSSTPQSNVNQNQDPFGPVNQEPFDTSLTDTSGGGGAGGGTGTDGETGQGFLQFFNGNWYNDPAQYYDAVNQEVDRQYNQSVDQANTDTGTQKTNFLQQVSDAIKNLQAEGVTGHNNIDSYYSGLGDIYQSGQGTRSTALDADITKNMGEIKTQEGQGVSAMDKALQDYLLQAQQTRELALNQNYNDAAGVEQSLAQGGVGSYRAYNPTLGQYHVQDTNSLLANLHKLLSEQNTGRRYSVPRGNKAPIYSYLNG